MSTPASPPVRPAATVVVLRAGANVPFEVLMVRRSDQVAFMAGAYVFPGGRVDDTDAAEPASACDGLPLTPRYADQTPDLEARFRVAAIRELLEEAGVLLARRDGAMADDALAAAMRSTAPAKDPIVAYLSARGLRVALDAVMPFAHWVTPEIETRRYDTRFLLARVPAGQPASHDARETTALEWMAPGEATERAASGEIMLPPPTWTTLRQLGGFASIDAAWDWASTAPIVRIQPGFFKDGDTTVLTLPGDRAHPAPAGATPFPATRFELIQGGGWRPR
jgi:8-oxo-dGTP pyrophosphatase MutT (NUDIX family)